MLYLIFFLFAFVFQNINAETVTVFDKTISQKRIEKQSAALLYSSLGTGMNYSDAKKETIEAIVNYNLAVHDAKQNNFHKNKDAQRMMDLALFNYYVQKQAYAKSNQKVSKKEYINFYNKYPTVTFSRLALYFNPRDPKDVKNKFARLSTLRGEIKNKTRTFASAIKMVAKDHAVPTNGTFGNVSIADLHPAETAILKKLKKKQVSPVITNRNFVVIYQIHKINKFSNSYKAKIKTSIINKRNLQEKQKFFNGLRKKYSKNVKVQ